MRNWTRLIGMAAVIVAATSVVAYAGAPDKGPAPSTSIVTLKLDETIVAKAMENGNALLAKAKWTTVLQENRTQSTPDIRLAVAGRTLLFQGPAKGYENGNDAFWALDLETGQKRWDASRVHFIESARMGPSDDQIEILMDLGPDLQVIRLSAKTGEQAAYPPAKFDNAEAPGVVSLATLADQQIIAGITKFDRSKYPPGSMGGITPAMINAPVVPGVRAYDYRTGQQQWATPVAGGAETISQPVVAGGAVYVVADQTTGSGTNPNPIPIPNSKTNRNLNPTTNPKSILLALDAKSGVLLWSAPPETGRQFKPVVQGQLVVTGKENGELIAYDVRTGREKWRAAISPDCDPAKSKFESIFTSFNQLFIDKELLVAPIPTYNVGANLNPNVKKEQRDGGGMAVFDLQSGKQAGYYNGITIWDVNGKGQIVPTKILHVHNDTIVGSGCMGINRKTLRLEWYIPSEAAIVADRMLYVYPKTQEGGPARIYAIPLEAW
jgi:outer membrane protein assembly factor BamB